MRTTTAPTRTISSFSLLAVLIGLLSTLLVGKVSPAHATTAGFSKVSGQGGIMSVGVWGTYVGPGPVSLTVGTTSNVLASTVAVVSVPKTAGTDSFYAQVTGLDSGTNYWFRLNSPTAVYTSPAAYKTRTRTVVIDWDQVDVYDDSDGWPNGCGDFRFSFAANFEPPRTVFHGYCLNDGESGLIGDTEGRWQGEVKGKTVDNRVYAFDDDDLCVAWENCGCPNQFTTYSSCGDFGTNFRAENVTKAGTRTLVMSVSGQTCSMLLLYLGTLTVTYS